MHRAWLRHMGVWCSLATGDGVQAKVIARLNTSFNGKCRQMQSDMQRTDGRVGQIDAKFSGVTTELSEQLTASLAEQK